MLYNFNSKTQFIFEDGERNLFYNDVIFVMENNFLDSKRASKVLNYTQIDQILVIDGIYFEI